MSTINSPRVDKKLVVNSLKGLIHIISNSFCNTSITLNLDHSNPSSIEFPTEKDQAVWDWLTKTHQNAIRVKINMKNCKNFSDAGTHIMKGVLLKGIISNQLIFIVNGVGLGLFSNTEMYTKTLVFYFDTGVKKFIYTNNKF